MPFTFFAHQLMVLPLKCAKPRWFDGTALCVGSMAPDFAYALDGTSLAFDSHSIAAQLCWSMPVALLITRFFRARLAEPIGAHLPGAWGLELSALARSKRTLFITCTSAWIGGLSHVFLDGFTHGRGWAVARFASLQPIAFELAGEPVPVWKVLQYVGHTFGTALGLLLMAALVRRRQFSRWNGLDLRDTAPATASATAGTSLSFWRTSSAGVLLASVAAVSGNSLPVAIIRAAVALFASVSFAALLAPNARDVTPP